MFLSRNHNYRQEIKKKIKPIKTKPSGETVLSLTTGREYDVPGIEADDLRIEAGA